MAAENGNRRRMNLRLKKGVLGRLFALALLGGVGAAVPGMIRTIRGIDSEGLPLKMETVDPAAVSWFAPDGKERIYWSRERDGSMRFWNRPGWTPDTKVEVFPATKLQRIEWERTVAAELTTPPAPAVVTVKPDRVQQSEIGRVSARLLPSHPQTISPGFARNEAAFQRMAPETAWISKKIYPGMFHKTGGAVGTHIEIRSPGNGTCEEGGRSPLVFSSGITRFRVGTPCLIHCRQDTPLDVEYRWISDGGR